jgi:hypothetical protein
LAGFVVLAVSTIPPVQTLFEYLEGGDTLRDFLATDERLRLSFPDHDCCTARYAGMAE